jgi:phenylacetic acid degradation operon negative regulatory protein
MTAQATAVTVRETMNARAALFDLYGDHLRPRGGSAPVSSLIQLLDALDIAGPAVRTAVSRMARQGWLEAVRESGGAAYRLTDRAQQRLDEAATRIYGADGDRAWDGRWSVLVVEHSRERSTRERLQRGLEYLGYRPLNGQAWVAPQPAVEAEDTIRREGLAFDEFRAEFGGNSIELIDRLYGLDQLASSYESWLDEAHGLVADAGDDPDDRLAFAVRSRLLHEWRKFLFRDPGLPTDLLPRPWPGTEAAAYFNEQAERLWPGASRYVDCCLQGRDP